MKAQEANKRRLLINNKFQLFFALYTGITMIMAFIVIVRDYIQVFVPVFLNESLASRISLPLKIMLLPGWVILTFLIFYVYLNARMMGVFQRINETCERIIRGENIRLSFRSKDSFRFVADTFNAMVDTLREREKNFGLRILDIRKKLGELTRDKKEVDSEIKEILEDLNKLKIDDDYFKDKSTTGSS